MTLERSIRLDVSVPDRGQRADQGLASGSGRQGEPPDPQSRQRFEQALAGASAGAGDSAQPVGSGTLPLLAQFPRVAFPVPSESVARDTRQLSALVAESVARLMVGEGAGGGKQVRMALSDDLLPGVTVTVQTLEGRLQVDFLCEIDSSRLRLVQALPGMAEELARRLARAVLVRVQTTDEDDPRLAQALAQGEAGLQPCEPPHA